MVTKTSANDCFEQIQEHIISVKYLPGTKLSIAALAEELNSDPTAVREGLTRLVAEGFAEAVDKKGFRVAPISEAEIRDLFQSYCQIEGLALKLALDRGDKNWEAQIFATLSQLSLVEIKSLLTEENYWLWSQRHSAFHTALISACASPHLMRMRNDLFRRFERYIRLAFVAGPLLLANDEHQSLADVVIKRERQKALRSLRIHALDKMEMLIERIRKHDLSSE